MNRIFCLATILMMLCMDVSYAAFPVKQQNNAQATPIAPNSISLPPVKSPVEQTQITRNSNGKTEVGMGFSIASLTCAIAALFIMGIPLSIGAVVFGALGIDKGYMGLAIAGIALGIVNILLIAIFLSEQ